MAKLGSGAIEAALILHTAAHDEHHRDVAEATAEHYATARPEADAPVIDRAAEHPWNAT